MSKINSDLVLCLSLIFIDSRCKNGLNHAFILLVIYSNDSRVFYLPRGDMVNETHGDLGVFMTPF